MKLFTSKKAKAAAVAATKAAAEHRTVVAAGVAAEWAELRAAALEVGFHPDHYIGPFDPEDSAEGLDGLRAEIDRRQRHQDGLKVARRSLAAGYHPVKTGKVMASADALIHLISAREITLGQACAQLSELSEQRYTADTARLVLSNR